MLKMNLHVALGAIALAVHLAQWRAVADDPAPSTEKLIEHLGSKKFAERSKAEKALQARGPSVLPELRKALKRPVSEEARRRIQTLVRALEPIAALQPKRVTLQAVKQPLSAILREIEKQTKYRVQVEGKEDPRISMRLKGVPFWEALERIGKETGRRVHFEPLSDKIELSGREGHSPFVVAHGPFHLEATRLHEDRDFDFTKRATGTRSARHDHRLILSVSIAAEPRFIVVASGQPRVEVALGDDGKALRILPAQEKPKPRIIDLVQIFLRDYQLVTRVLLQRSSEKARAIKVLRGTIPVQVVVARKPTVVTEQILKSRSTKHRVNNETIEITRMEWNSKEGSVFLAFLVPPPQEGVRRLWHHRIHVEDTKGNRYERRGTGSSTSGNRHEIHVNLAAPKNPGVGPPSRLILEHWVIVDHVIPFEFKNVPLP